LCRTRDYLITSHRPDGTWNGRVENDPQPTAFFLSTLSSLGRENNDETRELELFLASEQDDSGAWTASPDGPSSVDVSMVCVLALKNAGTERGRQARYKAQEWLVTQPPPQMDSFWRGYLALNDDLDWADLPYLTPRLVSNPKWVHPNIYDFSFVRIAVVSAIIIQACVPRRHNQKAIKREKEDESQHPEFAEWKRLWLAEAHKPMLGVIPLICGFARRIDNIFSTAKHDKAAIDWLLRHQERDGSFFSSVHMTSIAVVALHKSDPIRFEEQIENGINSMRKWQVTDERGRRQPFTDSTTWDTILCMDLLAEINGPTCQHVQSARDYILENQGTQSGDWSNRTRISTAGGWSFQHVGCWYPDCDDTAIALISLLSMGVGDKAFREKIHKGVGWLLAMQGSDGGWASWDRNDRQWMQIPNGGRWFARDLVSTEITARVIILLSRIIQNGHKEYDDLVPKARKALRRGTRWLRRNRQNGIWFGRWFTHYLYGTCHALEAYRELGFSYDHPEIQTALGWLLAVKNSDGGYGEASSSANKSKFVQAPSTPFHTACALIGLIHAGAANHPVAHGAAQWLLENQNADGTWKNKDSFAAGLPGVWYANFELTPTYFSAKSLLLFKRNLPTISAKIAQ
jgi:squalene-hopene/tetraprenyl-beta-curcumene cyclase